MNNLHASKNKYSANCINFCDKLEISHALHSNNLVGPLSQFKNLLISYKSMANEIRQKRLHIS